MTQKIESALAFIPSNHRETWINVGMAIQSELGESGFDVWDDWSKSASNYNAQAAKSVWKSFRGSGVTLGTLYREARINGWVDNNKYEKPSREQLEARKRENEERQTLAGIQREKDHQAAAKKAAWILHQTKPEQHAYLQSKGWPEAKGAVWWPDEKQNLLCIPMRVDSELVGVQMIDREGSKTFLKGQRTSLAEYVIDNSGVGAKDWVCEGYATALSIRQCLHALKMRYRIRVAFSASNLVKVAAACGSGFIVADNDESGTGERFANQTGLPFFLPPPGDFNDFHRREGLFRASQTLAKWLKTQ